MRNFKFIIIALSCILGVMNMHAQDWDALPNLKEIKGKKLLEKIEPMKNEKDGRWGYANNEGKFTIKPIFKEACPYEGKIARVCLNNAWGALNEKGLFCIYPMYQKLERFSSSDSLAVCSYGGKYGLLNTRGAKVLDLIYDSLEYADYGYIARKDGLLGTIDHAGKPLLEPQFEKIEILDRDKGISHVRKDGKWGLLRDGKEILAIKWDDRLTFLRNGSENQPDLYLAVQNGKTGVVSLYGDYVVPPVYDKIELSSSGGYYVTSRMGKYGAISLKMVEIVPAILDSKPFLGENIFKVHDDGRFYCANMNGSVDFGVCADLYQMFKPDEYVTTKYLPQWAKTHIIEENVQKRIDASDNAAAVCSVMSRHGYNVELASVDQDMPAGARLSLPAEMVERYGLLRRGVFGRTSQGGALYKAYEDAENNMTLEYVPGKDEYIVRMEDYRLSVNDAVKQFNIREFVGFYPKEYARMNEDVVMVSFAFVRQAGQSAASLIETDPYMLPVSSFPIKAYVGTPAPANETIVVISFSLDRQKALYCFELTGAGSSLLFSDFGGFYSCQGGKAIADMTSPLRKYDRYGRLDWEYMPGMDETFYDIEETENYIYLCGSVKEGNEEKPLLRQLSKRGKQVATKYGNIANARYSGLVCYDGMLYMKSEFLKGSPAFGRDYYPTYCLDRLNDNVGVWYKCVWEEWGTGSVGGLGLVDPKGNWLCTPNVSEQMSTAFDWEFGSFANGGEYLVVRHHGHFGLVSRDGSMLIDPKYELLEPLANPKYFRVRVDGSYGVVDMNDRMVVPFEYSYVGNMSEDIIIVSKDRMYGCFDKDGKSVVPMEYEEIREYVGGMARIRFKNRFGFIDKKGEIVVAPFSDEVENFSEGFTLVNIKGKMGFVSLDGDWIAAPMYEAGLNFSGGLAPLAMNGKYGYIDTTGKEVIPLQFSQARQFDSLYKIACVAVNGKWGVINTSGDTLVPMEFDKIDITSDGYMIVEKEGKSGIYTCRGHLVFEPLCDSIDLNKDGRLYRHGVVNARLEGNRIRIDEFGNIIHQYSMLTEKQL